MCSSTDLLVKYKFTTEELKISFLNKDCLVSIFCLFKLAIENEKILGKKDSKNTISKGNKKLPMQEYRIYSGPLKLAIVSLRDHFVYYALIKVFAFPVREENNGCNFLMCFSITRCF